MANFFTNMVDRVRGETQNRRIQYPPGSNSGVNDPNELFSFGMTNLSDGGNLEKLGAASSLVHACVERIISRATAADYYTEPHMPLDAPVRPHRRMSPYHWYRQLFEQMLYTGNALVWLDQQGSWNVGITRLSHYDESQHVWMIGIDREGTTIRREVGKGVIHFHMGRYEGITPHLVESPLKKIERALHLHNETRELLTDYAANGHRLAGTFQAIDVVQDPARMRNLVHSMQRALDVRGSRFATVAIPKFMEYRPIPQVNHPIFEGIDIALREIARVYGVPPELLGMLGYRGDYMSSDNHLLTESVFPLLDSVCGTWEENLGVSVSYWPLSLHRPTLNSAAHTLMGLAQTGVITINELRKLVGLTRIPDYDLMMPVTAGAGERGDEGGKNGSKNKGPGSGNPNSRG